jgi:hypothetical protein
MTRESAAEIIRDLENTEIPCCKKKLFSAETYSTCGNSDIEKQAKKDIEIYKKNIREYEKQIRELRSRFDL